MVTAVHDSTLTTGDLDVTSKLFHEVSGVLVYDRTVTLGAQEFSVTGDTEATVSNTIHDAYMLGSSNTRFAEKLEALDLGMGTPTSVVWRHHQRSGSTILRLSGTAWMDLTNPSSTVTDGDGRVFVWRAGAEAASASTEPAGYDEVEPSDALPSVQNTGTPGEAQPSDESNEP